jgi:Ca2+-binding EF-hand superfamily protein
MSAYQGVGLFTANEEAEKYQEEFTSMGMTESDVEKLFYIFQEIDTKKKNYVLQGQLAAYLSIPWTNFAVRMLKVFDEDGNGVVDFREFVLTIWNYCTRDSNQILELAFEMYDDNNSGKLTTQQVLTMTADLHGKNLHTG